MRRTCPNIERLHRNVSKQMYIDFSSLVVTDEVYAVFFLE